MMTREEFTKTMHEFQKDGQLMPQYKWDLLFVSKKGACVYFDDNRQCARFSTEWPNNVNYNFTRHTDGASLRSAIIEAKQTNPLAW
jgi:hypothetical protein